jgi:hypothetical protein
MDGLKTIKKEEKKNDSEIKPAFGIKPRSISV